MPASLFLPNGLDGLRGTRPSSGFTATSSRRTTKAAHVRRDYGIYFRFHQCLYYAKHRYVVLAPDYRGSTGYGKEWRQGIYRDLGGKEVRDISLVSAY